MEGFFFHWFRDLKITIYIVSFTETLTFSVQIFFDGLDSLLHLPIISHVQLYQVDIFGIFLQTSCTLAVRKQTTSENSKTLSVQIQGQTVPKATVTTWNIIQKKLWFQFGTILSSWMFWSIYSIFVYSTRQWTQICPQEMYICMYIKKSKVIYIRVVD